MERAADPQPMPSVDSGDGVKPPKAAVGTLPEGSSGRIEKVIELMREMSVLELRDLRDKVLEITK